MSTLKVIKMITGEEVMGDVDRAQGYTINKPVLISFNAAPQGQTQIGISAYPSFSESDTLSLNAEHVIFSYIPTKNLADIYAKHVSPIATLNTPRLVI
jgi:hypothetical protein|tara:strand:- start:974 stop:1267 length:294 start_codon:yes stop_codon:yes gene_type:complete